MSFSPEMRRISFIVCYIQAKIPISVEEGTDSQNVEGLIGVQLIAKKWSNFWLSPQWELTQYLTVSLVLRFAKFTDNWETR